MAARQLAVKTNPQSAFRHFLAVDKMPGQNMINLLTGVGLAGAQAPLIPGSQERK